MENRRSLNLAAVKLMAVQVPKLPLQHKISKTDMIRFAKPGLTEDLCIVQKEEFSITCYMCDTYTLKDKHIHQRQTHLLVRGCYVTTIVPSVQLQKRYPGREPRGVWRQDELIGGRKVTLTLSCCQSRPREGEFKYLHRSPTSRRRR
jgi:hypothetical protein